MVWSHRGQPVPLELYHGVPRGWSADEIIAEHTRLGSAHRLVVPHVSEPGAPSWLPERQKWLQYRAALLAIADGVTAGDAACVELAVRFIELRFIGSYSGFLREKLARRLRHASLNGDQRQRLVDHFLGLVVDGEHTVEFRVYMKLWRDITSERDRAAIASIVREKRGHEAARWIEDELQSRRGAEPPDDGSS